MPRPSPDQAKRIAIVGAGLIGAGWAAHFLAQGKEVVATDKDPKAATLFLHRIEDAWPMLVELGLKPGADKRRVRFVRSIEEAVRGVDFVQESVFEDASLKQDVLAEIDAHLAPDIVAATSNSGLKMTVLQAKCRRHPERIVLGHPFVPVYLVPLVEVGGDRCDPEAIQWALKFYEANGHRAIHIKKEILHHVSNRFQKVVFREVVRMVEDGVISAADADAAVCYGPGLRWAYMGPIMTRHLGGGAGGFRRQCQVSDQPTESGPDEIVPHPISPAYMDRLVREIEAQMEGRNFGDLEKERDRCLVGFRKVLKEARGD